MTTSMPWFRVYSEILDDRKIKRISKKTGHSKALVIGVWIGLLALANESSTRGELILSEDMPITREDLEDELGLPAEIIDQLIEEFANMGMVNGNATLKISNWEKRQFKSDNSTERVREYREKRYNETFPKRYKAVIDTDSDSESDTDSESDSEQRRAEAEAEQKAAAPAASFPVANPSVAILPILTRVANLPALPPKEFDRIEQIQGLICFYGEGDVEKSLKNAYQKWRSTKRKNGGGNYSPTNLGWVDWAQDELMRQNAPDKSFEDMTQEEKIAWAKQQVQLQVK